jgi:tripartite-type tricarboxylate transporter receptor subunit TctC
MNGAATWSIQTYQNSLEGLKTGKLRALATASRERLNALPDIPTVAELGYKDFEVDLWDGVFAPAGTSQERVLELADWFSAAIKDPAIRSKISSEAFVPVGECGESFVEFVRKQHEHYGRIIQQAGITK